MKKSYPTDLTDRQWELIEKFFDTGNYGKNRRHSNTAPARSSHFTIVAQVHLWSNGVSSISPHDLTVIGHTSNYCHIIKCGTFCKT
jgi:hypothetical protein